MIAGTGRSYLCLAEPERTRRSCLSLRHALLAAILRFRSCRSHDRLRGRHCLALQSERRRSGPHSLLGGILIAEAAIFEQVFAIPIAVVADTVPLVGWWNTRGTSAQELARFPCRDSQLAGAAGSLVRTTAEFAHCCARQAAPERTQPEFHPDYASPNRLCGRFVPCVRGFYSPITALAASRCGFFRGKLMSRTSFMQHDRLDLQFHVALLDPLRQTRALFPP